MVKYYMTDDSHIHEQDKITDGVWINMVDPTAEETMLLAESLDIDVADLRAALDEEESSRIELEDGYTLILIDVPSTEIRHKKVMHLAGNALVQCAYRKPS